MEPPTIEIVFALLVIAVVPVLRSVFVWARTWHSFVKLASKIPGPSLLTLLRNWRILYDNPEQYLYQLCQSYDFKPFRIITFGKILVPVSDPDNIAVVLGSKHLSDKPRLFYGTLASLMGENMFTMNGDTWKYRRHAFNPSFNKQVLGTYIPLFNFQALEFVKTLQGLCTGETIDITGLLFGSTMITSVKAGIWNDIGTEGYTKENLVSFAEKVATTVGLPGISMIELIQGLNRTIDEVADVIYVRNMNPPKSYLSYRHRNDMQRVRKDSKCWIDFFNELASARKQDMQSVLQKGDIPFSPSSSLEHLLVQKTTEKFTLSDKDLADELMFLILAGVETSTVTIIVTLALLALHPEVQNKVSEELYSIFEGSDRDATLDDLKRMKYLDCVTKEALRLFPAVPVPLREAKEDVDINGTIVPKGSLVALFLWGLHRNPKYFENPLEFRPERFCPGNVEKIPQYGFVPFSVGPRSCIGSRYAMIQVKTYVSTFLRSYEVRPGQGLSAVEDIKLATRFVLRFTSGVPVRLYPRIWDKRSL